MPAVGTELGVCVMGVLQRRGICVCVYMDITLIQICVYVPPL